MFPPYIGGGLGWGFVNIPSLYREEGLILCSLPFGGGLGWGLILQNSLPFGGGQGWGKMYNLPQFQPHLEIKDFGPPSRGGHVCGG